MSAFPKLTKLEREILNHRLSASDAISEVLGDDGYNGDAVCAIARLLELGDIEGAEKANKELSDEILVDAVEGSTFLGSASQESDQKQAAIYRAGESLADKIGKYVGRDVEYPVG
jgi:hypothetical protein